MASTLNLTVEQGATFRRAFVLTDAAGDVIDITGAIVEMAVRQSRPDGPVLLTASTTNGRIVVVGASGQFTIVIDADDTEALTEPGQYDLFVQFLAGDRVKLLTGAWGFEPRITPLVP